MKAAMLPSGNYRVQVFAGYDESGKRIMKSFTASKEWEALKMADDFLKGGREEVVKDAMTVRDAMEYYIKTKDNLLSPSTIYGYEMIVRSRLQSIMDKKIRNLTISDIQEAVNQDCLRLSRKSIKSALSLLHSALELQGIELSFKRITLPQKKKVKSSIPDVEKVIRLIVGTEVELPCLLAMWLSLRMSEIRGLQFRDISEDGRYITVQRVKLRINGRDVLREQTKTEESTRTNILPSYLKNLIDKVPHKKDSDYIVPHGYTYIREHFQEIMRANGITITFHQLRHEFATTLNDLGIPSDYIRKLGGWATDNVMKKVYTHTTTKKEEEYQKKIDGFFNSIIDESEN